MRIVSTQNLTKARHKTMKYEKYEKYEYKTLNAKEQFEILEQISEHYIFDILNDNARDFASFTEFLEEENNAFVVSCEFFYNIEQMQRVALEMIKQLNDTFTDTIFVCTYEFPYDTANESFVVCSVDNYL